MRLRSAKSYRIFHSRGCCASLSEEIFTFALISRLDFIFYRTESNQFPLASLFRSRRKINQKSTPTGTHRHQQQQTQTHYGGTDDDHAIHLSSAGEAYNAGSAATEGSSALRAVEYFRFRGQLKRRPRGGGVFVEWVISEATWSY